MNQLQINISFRAGVLLSVFTLSCNSSSPDCTKDADCSGYGTCNLTSHKCECKPGHTGKHCEDPEPCEILSCNGICCEAGEVCQDKTCVKAECKGECCGKDSCGALAWAKGVTPGNIKQYYDSRGWKIAALSDESIVVIGRINGANVFGSGEKNETTLTGPLKQNDWSRFMARYNKDGSLIWAKLCEECGNLAVMPDDTILTSTTGVTKFDMDGNSVWSVEIPSFPPMESSLLYYDHFRQIHAVEDGSFLVCGQFKDSLTLGKGESAETTLTVTDSSQLDAFVAKYNEQGKLVWAQKALPKSDCISGSSLKDGKTVVLGSLNSSEPVVFGEGKANETTLTPLAKGNLPYNFYLAQFGAGGEPLWARVISGDRAVVWATAAPADLAIFKDDSILIYLTIGGPTTFEADRPLETMVSTTYVSAVLAKYQSDGTLLWVRKLGGDAVYGGSQIARSLDDSFAITGYWIDDLLLGKGEQNETTFRSLNIDSPDFFTAKFYSDGSFSWAERAVGTSGGLGVVSLPNGSVAVTGDFAELPTTIFGQGEPNQTSLIPGNTWGALFTARYDETIKNESEKEEKMEKK